MPPAYWETLEEVSFRTPEDKGKRIPQERLVAEALNLLFAKYISRSFERVASSGHT
ncbi:hypothetical protein CN140_21690 [Sinorhizobium meliloti]|nr:hypothetical protein CN140_21690 [Sinorhizobium meliloti]